MGIGSDTGKRFCKAENYTQVKVYVEPDVAAAFKCKCQLGDTSIASVLSQFMTDYSKSAEKLKTPFLHVFRWWCILKCLIKPLMEDQPSIPVCL